MAAAALPFDGEENGCPRWFDGQFVSADAAGEATRSSEAGQEPGEAHGRINILLCIGVRNMRGNPVLVRPLVP